VKNELAVTLVQCSLSWEEAEENRSSIKSLLYSHKATSDLIILPEMFTTGFSMNAKSLAEQMDGKTHLWMKEMAEDLDSVLIGSLIIEASGKYYNRLLVVSPSGKTEHYDKRHLFSFAGEDENYHPGLDRLIFECHGWRICPLVCYDLRFPIWSRNAELNGGVDANLFDLLIYVANWPKARRQPWINLLEARAHENQAYVIGVNRIGQDGNNIEYFGDSVAYSPKGKKLSEIKANQISVETVLLNKDDLLAFREKFPVGTDKDRFKLMT
jgi:omega-amidase